MNRAEALAILALPRERAVNLIIAIGEKAERWDVLQAQGAANTPISPTTPSGMTPVYLKPRARRRSKKPGRKPGHVGACRPAPEHINGTAEHHRLKACPHCGTAVDKPIRGHTRLIEDIPKVVPLVTAHTVHGYWCSHCKIESLSRRSPPPCRVRAWDCAWWSIAPGCITWSESVWEIA